MKRYLLLILLLSKINLSYTQTNVYQPFPLDSAVWVSEYGTNNGTSYSRVTLLGDTVINSLSYTKTYSSSYPFTVESYSGGIRQDIPNEKVYRIDLSGIETDISVNQHLDSGNVIPLGLWGCTDTSVITKVDSMFIGGTYHKVYHLWSEALCQGIYVMGIGIVQSSGWEWGMDVMCFSVNNITLYGGGGQYCMITSVNENNKNKIEVFITPNPCNDKLIIEAPMSMLGGNLTIFNNCGTEIFTQDINNLKTQIDVSHFPKGLFIAKLTTESTIIVKKIIKE